LYRSILPVLEVAVAVVEVDVALEDVDVVALVWARGVGARDPEQVEQLGGVRT
jgi:hypothetical protein